MLSKCNHAHCSHKQMGCRRSVTVQVADDEVDIGETAPAPKKVAKKKEVAAPSASEADLASIVDDWDD